MHSDMHSCGYVCLGTSDDKVVTVCDKNAFIHINISHPHFSVSLLAILITTEYVKLISHMIRKWVCNNVDCTIELLTHNFPCIYIYIDEIVLATDGFTVFYPAQVRAVNRAKQKYLICWITFSGEPTAWVPVKHLMKFPKGWGGTHHLKAHTVSKKQSGAKASASKKRKRSSTSTEDPDPEKKSQKRKKIMTAESEVENEPPREKDSHSSFKVQLLQWFDFWDGTNWRKARSLGMRNDAYVLQFHDSELRYNFIAGVNSDSTCMAPLGAHTSLVSSDPTGESNSAIVLSTYTFNS
jgi:hypothetical protein